MKNQNLELEQKIQEIKLGEIVLRFILMKVTIYSKVVYKSCNDKLDEIGKHFVGYNALRTKIR